MSTYDRRYPISVSWTMFLSHVGFKCPIMAMHQYGNRSEAIFFVSATIFARNGTVENSLSKKKNQRMSLHSSKRDPEIIQN